jgi:hypothetical protein
MKIYKQKVFVHHYANFMGGDAKPHFDECLYNCESIINSYSEMEMKHNDVTSGKFEESKGEDPTSNEFID